MQGLWPVHTSQTSKRMSALALEAWFQDLHRNFCTASDECCGGLRMRLGYYVWREKELQC